MKNVRPLPTRRPFVADVAYDAESKLWVVSCDALSVSTEAPSYEALTARFWEIAPEIAAANGIAFGAHNRVVFRHVEDNATRHRLAR